MLKSTAMRPVIMVKPAEAISDRFVKQELILDDSNTSKDGTVYPNPIPIEFTNDRIKYLTGVTPGMMVNVEYFPDGREYNGKHYVSLRGLTCTIIPPGQGAQPTAAPQPVYQAPQPQGFAPQPQANGYMNAQQQYQQMFQPAAPAQVPPPPAPATPDGNDDLPF